MPRISSSASLVVPIAAAGAVLEADDDGPVRSSVQGHVTDSVRVAVRWSALEEVSGLAHANAEDELGAGREGPELRRSAGG
jgi:hypothetical protein